MSDLVHDAVPLQFIQHVFDDVMVRARHRVFQVLTATPRFSQFW
jgi:protein gp37